MSTPLAYLNGRFLPFNTAGLSLHDAGFVSGATVVDNSRTFRHELYRWPDHMTRFRRDCAACYVPLEASAEQLTMLARELVHQNAALLPSSGELQLVTFATPGPLGFYQGEVANGPATLGMVTYPLPFGRYRRFFMAGVTLAVAGRQSSDAADLLPPTIKHRSRMFWHVAERLLNDPNSQDYHPGAIPLVWNQDGIGDTPFGCILAVVDEMVILPRSGTVLESISLKVVRELCAELGLRCAERSLDLRMLLREGQSGDDPSGLPEVSELLLAGSGFCLAGVSRLARGTISRGFQWPGPVYLKLLAAWSAQVKLDIAGQFMNM
jgi:branched-subunit amino acid aminotransferase/4-amino-4-deoxychorismate lyase